MRMKQRTPIITAAKRKIYECDAATIAFFGRVVEILVSLL